MVEREWLLPSVLLTVLLGGTALLIMPNHSGVLPALGLLPLWLMVSGMLAAVQAWFRMIRSGVKSPFGHIAKTVRDDWRGLLAIGAGVTLAGLNMCAFMWTKPLLNYYVAFWADPYLAQFDRLLFVGHDPWTLLSWLNSFATALFYHRAWFAMMIITLLAVLTQPPSPQKSAVMMTYFLLWSVVGPVIHMLLPAAGPVFFEKLGYGDRFAGMKVPAEMTEMSDYLWQVYQTGHFGPGSGISAMPSLHIATTVWMVLAVYVLARKWTWAVAIPGALIFLLSISLGWHYAADGIVGGAAAIGCYRLCLRLYGRRPRPGPAGVFKPQTV
jgi:PAP2 superfamily